MGSGLTDFVLDSTHQVYCYLLFNPSVLKGSLSDVLTRKEQSCFAHSDSSFQLAVYCNSSFSGFLYILLHEMTHVVDFVAPITPYVEPACEKAGLGRSGSSEATMRIWKSYNRPVDRYDFAGRSRITFYGLGGGPKLNIADAPSVYDELRKTCFPSLYASLNWADDLAELLTFYHLTQVLKTPIVFRVRHNGRIVCEYEPAKNSHVISRFPSMAMFY